MQKASINNSSEEILRLTETDPLLTVARAALRRVRLSLFEVKSRIRAPSALSPDFLPRTARPAPLRDARRRSTIKLLYGPGIASPGLAKVRDIVHMVCLYNILTDTEPPRARPGPPRPSSASGGPPAAARCGGVTNPTTEHRDAVGRSEVQLGVCIAHPGLSPGPINRRLRRRAQELVFTRSKCVPQV